MSTRISDMIIQLRKQRDWSQTDLAKQTDVSQVMIGKYERGDAVPSLEVGKKLADALGVSLDFLAGDALYTNYDKALLKRMQGIQQMDQQTQTILFNLIDTYIQNFKTKQAFA